MVKIYSPLEKGDQGGCNRPRMTRIKRIDTDLCIYLIRKLDELQKKKSRRDDLRLAPDATAVGGQGKPVNKVNEAQPKI